MKIAIIGIITRPISSDTHGGTEAITYALVEELVMRGHQVTLYAAADSHTSARLVSVCDSETAQITSMNGNLAQPYSLLLARQLAEHAGEFDIIHNNFFHTYIMSAFAPFVETPLVHTVHNSYFSDSDWKKALRAYSPLPHERYVFVSDNARSQAGGFPGSTVIRNAIDTSFFRFNERPQDYMLWIGRMVPEKGSADAVRAVKDTGRKLTIVTVLKGQQHNEYLDAVVTPLLDERITLTIGHTADEKVSMYQQAKGLFFPSMWEEPFGLVMTEAMACGTPVIAYARGATSEIIQDGVTGFLVNASDSDIRGDFITKKTGIEGLKEAMNRLYALPPEKYAQMREACRKNVEARFAIPRMVDQYEALYRSIIRSGSIIDPESSSG